MSQEYHITRAPDWRDTGGAEISASQWREYAQNDDELRPDPANARISFVWIGHPAVLEDAWLDWSDGNVYALDPDQHLTTKMLQVARSLGAQVVDDHNRAVTQGVKAE